MHVVYLRDSVDNKYNPTEVEAKIRKFWSENKVFAFDENSDKQVYSIDTPPPTVSGEIHLGHVFSYSQAEFIARYKRMRGFNVFYPFGLDNNGLPTELRIEKDYGVNAETLGRDKFIDFVREKIQPYNEKYVELWQRLGLSVDWQFYYQTISKDVQKISQTSFLELLKMDRIYQMEAPLLFCPKCRTAVSQMELEDKEEDSKIYTIEFSDNVQIATSRPELLPACVAILVNPEDKKHAGIIGKTVKTPIFGDEVKVIADRKVDPEFGTGVVMCCTFGDQTDIEWYKQYKLGLKIIINEQGKMTHPYYNNAKIRDAREKIVNDLKGKGLVKDEKPIKHSVNVHERCGTEIEFLVKKQWYVKYLDLKDKFLEYGNEVKWHPEYMKVRYDNWVNGLHWDWCISRQRFFGVYFPIWYCKKCGEPMFAEKEQLPVNPFADKPKSACKCGGTEFDPETDVMDTWATSSLTPLINARWGIDNKYLKKIFPMNLRPQAHDIISFWAFTTIVKSYLHMQSIPWKDIMISGHGLDSHGQAMHKSKGNVVLPMPYIEKYGADPLRYWASSSVLGENNSFQEKEVIAGSRLINKMWNVGKFIELKCKEFGEEKELAVIDKWILAELNKTVKLATAKFESFDYFGARNAIEEFFWIFANDYLEFAKNRIYSEDKAAKYVMNKVFFDTIKMMSPFIAYSTEEVYQNLIKDNASYGPDSSKKSIHITSWPVESTISEYDEKSGEALANTIRGIRKWKHDNKKALNSEILKLTLDSSMQPILGNSVDEIKTSINVKAIEFGSATEEIAPGIKASIVA